MEERRVADQRGGELRCVALIVVAVVGEGLGTGGDVAEGVFEYGCEDECCSWHRTWFHGEKDRGDAGLNGTLNKNVSLSKSAALSAQSIQSLTPRKHSQIWTNTTSAPIDVITRSQPSQTLI